MNLTRWNPFQDLDQLFGPYQRLLARRSSDLPPGSDWLPAVDITEDDQEYLIKAELPEVAKEDIKVQLDNGTLSFSGERRHEKKDDKQHRIERVYGSFTRSFSLPANVDGNQISAEHRDGMLYLHLPKVAVTKPKATEIPLR